MRTCAGVMLSLCVLGVPSFCLSCLKPWCLLRAQIFSFEPRGEPGERLTRLQKRMYRSPAAVAVKSRQVHRARDRANTAAYKGAMLAGEGW